MVVIEVSECREAGKERGKDAIEAALEDIFKTLRNDRQNGLVPSLE